MKSAASLPHTAMTIALYEDEIMKARTRKVIEGAEAFTRSRDALKAVPEVSQVRYAVKAIQATGPRNLAKQG